MTEVMLPLWQLVVVVFFVFALGVCVGLRALWIWGDLLANEADR